MRFKQANDAFREQWNVVPSDITKTDKGLLKQMLDNTIESYKSQNISDLDKYYFAFVECIENVFPDEPWYENIGLDIRMDLFNTRSPEETAQHIVDAITDADAYVEENKILTEDTVKKQNGKWTNRGDDGKEHGEFKTKKEADAQRKAMFANGYKSESIKESANPENAEINKIIYDVATGKSKAIQKLKKLGYEVEIDDKARKEFGRKSFGDTIRITNPETGNVIVGNTGTSIYGNVKGDFLRATSKYGSSHILKPGKYSKEVTADKKDFDYKTFLDKKHDEPLSKETTISQFKKDKKLINDNQNLYKQLKDADDRLSNIRSKIKSRNNIKESILDDAKLLGTGYTAPIATNHRRYRIKNDLEYINHENPNYSKVAKDDLIRAYNEILADIEEVEDFDAYWAEHKKALMSELKAQLDLIPADIRD